MEPYKHGQTRNLQKYGRVGKANEDNDLYDLNAHQFERRSDINSSSNSFRSLLYLVSLSRPAIVLSTGKRKSLKVLISAIPDATAS